MYDQFKKCIAWKASVAWHETWHNVNVSICFVLSTKPNAWFSMIIKKLKVQLFSIKISERLHKHILTIYI